MSNIYFQTPLISQDIFWTFTKALSLSAVYTIGFLPKKTGLEKYICHVEKRMYESKTAHCDLTRKTKMSPQNRQKIKSLKKVRYRTRTIITREKCPQFLYWCKNELKLWYKIFEESPYFYFLPYFYSSLKYGICNKSEWHPDFSFTELHGCCKPLKTFALIFSHK